MGTRLLRLAIVVGFLALGLWLAARVALADGAAMSAPVQGGAAPSRSSGPTGETVQLASTYPVTNTNNSGVGSLRQAITDANNNAGADTVTFNIPSGDPNCTSSRCVITPASQLPALSGGGTTINGYSQPGASPASASSTAVIKIELSGASIPGERGLILTTNGNVVRGLAVYSFTTGIEISADSNIISGNHLGTDWEGTSPCGGGMGVNVTSAGSNNTIGGDEPAERNVISGSSGFGVRIDGDHNTVSGNFIGVDLKGLSAVGNGTGGVYIEGPNNTIGGDVAGERNIISGNSESGVRTEGSQATGNAVSGNYIGMDVTGAQSAPNASYGVQLGGSNNIVGGDTAGERNVISGNGSAGIEIWGTVVMTNTVSGNYIGLDATGTVAMGNGGCGVEAFGSGHVIGGDTSGERNVISDNGENGVLLGGSGGHVVSGNYIGTNAAGTADVGNGWDGVRVQSSQNTIGGDTLGERNVISGNDNYGISMTNAGATDNVVSRNYVGVASDGSAALGNSGYGISLVNGSCDNTIGPYNVIAHNTQDGVYVDGAAATHNVVTQNSIYGNAMGINLTSGANGDILPPAITDVSAGSAVIEGTACPGCVVEVFVNGDSDGEGETYIGNDTADGSGDFTVTVLELPQEFVTATATGVISGTSEFSPVFTSTFTSLAHFLPVVMKTH